MTKIKIINEEFNIKNENELILLFININKHGNKQKNLLIWNVITELDDELEKIITTNNGLINILKRLDENRALLLLSKISEKLALIIENSENLGELLAKFSSNSGYKTQIIKNLRGRGLKYIIRTAKDFQNTVEWLFENAENEIFKLLENKFIKKLFSNCKEIGDVLYYLTPSNKEIFLKILGHKYILSKIFTYIDLADCCKAMPNNYFKILIENMGNKKVLNLFNFEKDFYNFLLSLPQSKEKIFLDFLNTNKNG